MYRLYVFVFWVSHDACTAYLPFKRVTTHVLLTRVLAESRCTYCSSVFWPSHDTYTAYMYLPFNETLRMIV